MARLLVKFAQGSIIALTDDTVWGAHFPRSNELVLSSCFGSCDVELLVFGTRYVFRERGKS